MATSAAQGNNLLMMLDCCRGGRPTSAMVREHGTAAEILTQTSTDATPAWDAPVMVGGGTGRSYELLERVSDLRRDQRFRQIYPRTGATGGAIEPPLPIAHIALGRSIRQAAGTFLSKPDGGDALVDSMGSAESERQGDGRAQPERRILASPPALATLRRSLATALTQLWPWGRGPQACQDSTETCPAHLIGGGAGGSRQVALAHTELVKVR